MLYTQAIKVTPKADSVYYSNRAACALFRPVLALEVANEEQS